MVKRLNPKFNPEHCGGDDELDLLLGLFLAGEVLVDDVLPAHAVAVLLLDGAHHHNLVPENDDADGTEIKGLVKRLNPKYNPEHWEDARFLGRGTCTVSQIFYTSPSRCAGRRESRTAPGWKRRWWRRSICPSGAAPADAWHPAWDRHPSDVTQFRQSLTDNEIQ